MNLFLETASEARQRTSTVSVAKLFIQKESTKFKKPCILALEFSGAYSEESKADGRIELQKLINDYILAQPRDWRVSSSYAGNFQKPFIDFASKILGLHSDWMPEKKENLSVSLSHIVLFRINHATIS